MIIYLPIKLSPTGGTSTFARKLQAGLARRGHEVTFAYQPTYDVLLASPTAPWRDLLEAKRRRKKIIQRLDGVYYPTTTAGWLYPLHNARLALIRQAFAPVTIYQSEYSRRCCDYFLGNIRPTARVIYNGVDLDHFSPRGVRANLRETPDQHIFLTAARFRRQDQIMPVIQAFQTYCRRHHENSRLIIIGNFEGRVVTLPGCYAGDRRVQFLGIVPNDRLPHYLRAADVFLCTHLNPPCPNNILEALACGLPIGGVADGAMPELIESGQEGELLPADGEAWYVGRKYDTTALADRLKTIMRNRAAYAAAGRQRAEAKFGLEQMIDNYLAVIDESAKKSDH